MRKIIIPLIAALLVSIGSYAQYTPAPDSTAIKELTQRVDQIQLNLKSAQKMHVSGTVCYVTGIACGVAAVLIDDSYTQQIVGIIGGGFVLAGFSLNELAWINIGKAGKRKAPSQWQPMISGR